ncbi:MAG: penicillin-binding protein 2 [Deltaproteobacteria bacterium]|nr:penicillin-binding protein 2 [Deltaproteobacteria bacterium]
MKTYLHTVSGDWYRRRVSGALVLVVAAFLILLGRLYYLQVIEGPELVRQSQSNWFRTQGIPPMRGLIFDRNGVLLVDNRPAFDVSIVPREAKNPEEVIHKLAELIDVAPEPLLTRLVQARKLPSFKPILLETDVSRDNVAIIEAHNLELPGVLVTVEPKRHYIEGARASHLIGYLGEISREELSGGAFPDNRAGDFIGKFGVEKAFESYFHGRRGWQQVEVNAFGRVTRALKTEEALPGNNIHLSLDIELQRLAESLLADKVGTVVAMDPSNGHVLAMAGSPAFDPNAFVEGMTYQSWDELISNPFRAMENKAIQGQYPPGSTYKIVAAIAGLEEEVISPHTKLFCPGQYRYGNRTFRCWKRRGHGFMNLEQALAQSCDVYFYQVGEKLGVDRLAKYAKACGLGSPTGIELDKEAKGLVPTSVWKLSRVGVPWQGGETLSVVIGQGFNLVTPMQMLGLISAVANGGILYKPLVVRRIESPDGSFVKEQGPVPLGKLPVSQQRLHLIRKSLYNAVNKPGGTAWGSRIPGIGMAGKTGTAQVVGMPEDGEETSDENKILRFRDHAWFIAYAPAKDPQIAVVVLIEHGGHGSSGAAPLAKKIVEKYLGIDDL